jgi:hypothetical protein
MARFTIQLDKRRELHNGLYNLVVRVNVGNDMIYLNIAKLTEQQYDHVFIKRAGDEESITFREKCEKLRTKCERDFNKIKPFNKARFRELFYEKDKKVSESLVLKDLFKDYITSFENIKHNTRIRYRTIGNVFESRRAHSPLLAVGLASIKIRKYQIGIEDPRSLLRGSSIFQTKCNCIRYYS